MIELVAALLLAQPIPTPLRGPDNAPVDKIIGSVTQSGRTLTVIGGGGGGGSPGGVSGNLQINNGLGGFGAYAGATCGAGTYATAVGASGALTCVNPLAPPLTLTGTTNTVPLTVKGMAGQTANLQEWRSANGDVVGYVNPAGNALFSSVYTPVISGVSALSLGFSISPWPTDPYVGSLLTLVPPSSDTPSYILKIADDGSAAVPTNMLWLEVGGVQIFRANSDGSLNLGTLNGTPVALGNINASGVRSASTFLRGDGSWQVPPGTYSLPDATSLVTGGVRLTGDLGGTATSPTVPGLAGKAASSVTISTTAPLSGGGDLTTNRTLTVAAATTALGVVKMAAACAAGSHVASIGVGGELTCTADAGGGGGGVTVPLTLTGTTNTVPLTVDGMAGQTANLQEWKTGGTLKAYIDPNGIATIPVTSTAQMVNVASGVNNKAFGAVYSSTDGAVLTNQTGGATDIALSTAWVAFKFTAPATEIGSVSVFAKKSVGTADSSTISGYIYSDATGVPGTDIDVTGEDHTGLPIIAHASAIGTTYTQLYFDLRKTGLTNGGTYWIVLSQAATGGTFSLLGQASGGPLNYATAPDSGGVPGTWTGAATTLDYQIIGAAGNSFYAVNTNGTGYYANVREGFGGHFISNWGPGIKGTSEHNYGVGGFSTWGLGVGGSSINNYALRGVSTNYAALLAQTQHATMPGAQILSVGGPAVQAVSSSGLFFQGLDGTYAQKFAVDYLGNVSAVSFNGPLVGNASTATALSTAGAANQYWKNGNVWGQVAYSEISGTPAPYVLPDATNLVTGGVRLTGDLGGTATSPTVPGLTGKAATVTCGANTWASTLGSGTSSCTQPAFSNLSGTATAAQIPAASTTLGGVKMAAGCSAGNHVASIGAGGELTCTADAGGSYTLPAATATVLGGVKGTGTSLTCTGTDKATGFAADGTLQCAADQTGGAGSANAVSVSITFSSGTGVYSATVSAPWVTATSKLACTPQATTADGQTIETYFIAGFQLTVANVVASTGFDLFAYSPRGVSGVFRFSCTGV